MDTFSVCGSAQALWKDVSPVPVVEPSKFNPVEWVSGEGIGAASSYIHTHVLKGSAPSIALTGMIVLGLIMFLGWRLLRCLLCCAPGNFHLSIYEKLTDQRLMMYKISVAALAVSILAPVIGGMIVLPRDPFKCFASQTDNAFNHVFGVLDVAETARDAMQGVHPKLDNIKNIIDEQVNRDQIQNDVEVLESFLLSLPNPNPSLSSLRDLNQIIDGPLLGPVNTLKGSTDIIEDVWSQLSTPVLASQSLLNSSWHAQMESLLSQYWDALDSLPSPDSLEQGDAARAWRNLRSAQNALQTSEWLEQIQVTTEDVAQIQEFDDQDLPFSLLRGMEEPAHRAQDALGPIISVLDSVERLDVLTAKETLSRLNSTLSNIDQNLVKLNNEAIMEDFRSATKLLDMLLDLQKDGSANSTGLKNSKTSDTFTELTIGRLLRVLRSLNEQLDHFTAVQSSNSLPSVANQTAATVKQVHKVATSDALSDAQQRLQLLKEAIAEFEPRALDVEKALENVRSSASPSKDQYSRLFSTAKTVQPSANNTLLEVRSLAPLVRSLEAEVAQGALDAFKAKEQQVSKLQHQLSLYPSPSKQQDWIEALEEAVTAYNELPENRAEVLDRPRTQLDNALDVVYEAINDVESELDSILDEYGGHLDDFREDVLPDIIAFRDDALDFGRRHWEPAYQAWQGGYALQILLVGILVFTVLTSCPGGLVFTAVALLAWLIIWMVLSVLILGTMVVLADLCAHAERIIIDEVESRASGVRAVPSYYLYGMGGGYLKAALKADGLVDVDQVQADIDTSQQQMMQEIEQDYVLQPELQMAVDAANVAVDDAQMKVNDVVGAATRGPVVDLYQGLKTCACCTLGSELFTQWMCVTISGLLGFLTVLVTAAVVRRFDDLPSSNCTGCKMHRAKDYKECSGREQDSPTSSALSSERTWWGAKKISSSASNSCSESNCVSREHTMHVLPSTQTQAPAPQRL